MDLMKPRNKPVLLAEDDEHDVFFMRRAFERVGVAAPLQAVRDGQEAIDYLSGAGQYGDRSRYPFPCLLVTDIKMPRLDGFDVLAWLQQRPEFNDLPRLVVSSSCQESDLKYCLDLGARGYWMKPSSVEKLDEVVREWQHTFLAEHCATV